MAKIGYMRVSTLDQNLDRQKIALNEIGMDKIFMEKVSGKNMDRPALKMMFNYIREGDVLYVESISRLARSTRDLLSIVEQLQEKKIELISLKENIDTTTPQGRFILTIFGALSELERESILQRQKEGIAAARLNGTRFGRPALNKPEEWDEVIALWENGSITATQAMDRLEMSKSTFYRKVAESKPAERSLYGNISN